MLLLMAHTAGAVPPPPSLIKTPDGRTFRLYDNVSMTQPALGGLRDRGFNAVFTWDRPPPGSGSFDVAVAPPVLLQNGSAAEADVRSQVRQICVSYVDATQTTLIILDAEWESLWSMAQPTAQKPYATFVINGMDLANMATILRWARSEFANTACAGRVRMGWYDAIPTWWNSFYSPQDSRTLDSWRQMVRQIVTATAPYMDVLSPSLYAPWSAADNPGLGMSHITAWTLAASDTLAVSHGFANEFGLTTVPFIGLRYYHGAPATLNHLVEQPLFQAMVTTISSPQFNCEGAVYWDWGAFGGPNYANDGTDTWNTSAPWYLATFAHFSAPEGSLAAVQMLLQELVIRN
jgi:hypothetical protein